MKSRIPGIFPLLLITLLCVGLVEGGYLLFEHFVLKTFESHKTSEPLSTTNPENKTADAMKNDYRVILQRNLFGPPPDSEKSIILPVPDPKVALSATTLEIVLMGTIIGNAGNERAIIMDKKSFKQNLYEKGDAVKEALVKEISRGKVILSYNGKDEILDMSEAAKVRLPVKVQPQAIPAPIVPGQSNTPLRVVPRSAKAIDPGTPVNEMPMSTTLPPGASTSGAPTTEMPMSTTLPPGAIDPGTPAPNMSAPVPEQPVNVERVKRTLVPQRLYRPSQPINKQ
jgi:hypothetical protein